MDFTVTELHTSRHRAENDSCQTRVSVSTEPFCQDKLTAYAVLTVAVPVVAVPVVAVAAVVVVVVVVVCVCTHSDPFLELGGGHDGNGASMFPKLPL